MVGTVRRGRGMGRAFAVAALAMAALAVPANLAYADLPSQCSQAGPTVTCQYGAGPEQTLTVPAGVTSLSVDAVGAAGANTNYSNNTDIAYGGKGADVTGQITVTSGENLFIEVGVGGGPGGSVVTGRGGVPGGAGGGESDVRTCSGVSNNCPGGVGSLATRLIVAGGGGGRGRLCAQPH